MSDARTDSGRLGAGEVSGLTVERVRRRHVTVGIAACVLAALAYIGTVLMVSGDLPGTMATHFGASGEPDAFTDTTLALLLQGAVVIGVPVALLVVFRAGEWWRGAYARTVSGLVVGLAAGMTTLFVEITLAHAAVATAEQVTVGAGTLLLALGVGVAAALLSMLALPKALPRQPVEAVVPIEVTPSQRLSWFGRAHTGQAALVVLSAAATLIVVAAIGTGIWWLALIGLFVVLLVLAVTSFGVTVDMHGVSWRSALGFPRGAVRLADIAKASVIDVSPGDFGGLGLRILPGRLGLITRSGRALRVQHGRGELVITVDDAGTAAGVIEGLRAAR